MHTVNTSLMFIVHVGLSNNREKFCALFADYEQQTALRYFVIFKSKILSINSHIYVTNVFLYL